MQKRIISVLMVVVFILTMTACAKSTTHNTLEESTTNKEVVNQAKSLSVTLDKETEATEPFNPWRMEDYIEYIEDTKIATMTLEEVNALAENLVHMSATANLSPRDMYNMGLMFNHIWHQCPKYDNTKLEKEFSEAFDNVYKHAKEIGFTLDYLEPWIYTPVPEVIIKYLSSDNFEEPFTILCHSINELSEEDLAVVTEAFVNNPTMVTNARIARSIICCTDNAKTSQMAWEHLIELSNCNEVADLEPWDSSIICWNIFSDYDLVYEQDVILEKVYNTEYITKIMKNILANPHFDFSHKYAYFCSDFFVGSDVDVEISRIAMTNIQDLLAYATEEELIQIANALTNVYSNEAGIEMQNVSEPLRDKYIYLLTYCLARMSN